MHTQAPSALSSSGTTAWTRSYPNIHPVPYHHHQASSWTRSYPNIHPVPYHHQGPPHGRGLILTYTQCLIIIIRPLHGRGLILTYTQCLIIIRDHRMDEVLS